MRIIFRSSKSLQIPLPILIVEDALYLEKTVIEKGSGSWLKVIVLSF